MTAESLTAQVAAACHQLSLAAMPPEVVQRARLIVLDTLGAMLGASAPSYPGRQRLAQYARAESPDGPCLIVGTDLHAGASTAAFVGGYLAYALDIESHHGPAVMHAAAATLPAALAVAQETGAAGRDLLTAAVLGVEVACRVSLAIGPKDLYARSFHPTAVAGAFGAAAASARLLGASPPLIANAFGLAATQASGLLAWASDHTEESRPLNPGIAARNGVVAGRLAALGFGAPQDVFDRESEHNVFRAWSLNGKGQPAYLAAPMGPRFAISELTIKRYACCAFLHPALDVLLAIMGDHDVAAPDIAKIVMRFPPSGTPMVDDHPLRSHCAQYVLPLAAVRGDVTFDDVLHDRSVEPEISRLREVTSLLADDRLEAFYPERYSTIVEVTTQKGTTHSRRLDWAVGCPEDPMSDDAIVDKFMTLAGGRVGLARASELADVVRSLDEREDLTNLFAALTVEDRR
jgi:2-methylcitrate dehydratase PrpD